MFIQTDCDNYRAYLQANIRHDDRSSYRGYPSESTYNDRTYIQWFSYKLYNHIEIVGTEIFMVAY
jgi:hypothetical protein